MQASNIQKANTAYIGSRKQVQQARLQADKSDIKSRKAKAHFQEQNAQRVVEAVQARIEESLDQCFDDFTVVESYGDCIRKCVAKVRVGRDEYVHIHCQRDVRSDPWTIGYDPYKTATDFLSDSKWEYEELNDGEGDMVCSDTRCAIQ